MFKELNVGDIIHQPWANGYEVYVILEKTDTAVKAYNPAIVNGELVMDHPVSISRESWNNTITSSANLYHNTPERKRLVIARFLG